MDAQWILKHQDLVPSVLLCFYDLVSDPTLATLCDNRLKTDLNNLRGLLSQSGYKTRLAVVLFSDQDTHSVDSVQERLEAIRRACAIDAKSLFLAPSSESPDELERMAENMLTTLYGVAIEYFRDLGRHSRKKKARGVVPQPTVPPTSGTSQTLSQAGWNVRYDFKSAMFAEYRLELGNALLSFEQAYENLLGPELLEAIPSWSPRWNEARFLADVIAVRCLRCLLWNGQHSAAARRWQSHRDRIAEFVDRRGRGISNYGWKAWEARWAIIMANLIERTAVSGFTPATMNLYLQPEKNVMGERLQPWEMLHHTGYWYHLAAKHLSARRNLAHAMSEDDRRPPSSSPASHVANNAFTYDTYMCPDPHDEYPLNGAGGVDHSRMIVDCLKRARSEFLKRHQFRFAAELSLECAKELALVRDWKRVVELLRSLWRDMSFRSEGWVAIAEDLSWALRSAAAAVGDADLIIAIDWELLGQNFTRRTNWHYDITRSLEGIAPKSKPSVHIEHGELLPFVSASFVFRDEEGKAGQSTRGQLAIKSNAQQGSAPVVLKSIEIEFSGSVGRVVLQHQAGAATEPRKHGSVALSAVSLTDAAEDGAKSEVENLDESNRKLTLRGNANLTLLPSQTTVFGVDIPLREAGETRAVSLKLSFESEAFDLQQSLYFGSGINSSNLWYISASSTKRIARAIPLSVRVLPRPPKLKIKAPAWKDQYYNDEPIQLEFEIVNDEADGALAKLDVDLFGEDTPVFSIEVVGQGAGDALPSSTVVNDESKLRGLSLGTIESSKALTVRLNVPPIERSNRYDLTMRVTYHLSTDPGTPIVQTALLQLNVVNPFEANYDLLPRVHPDPWPSMFDYNGVNGLSGGDDDGNDGSSGSGNAAHAASTALTNMSHKGISQAWCLVTRYASFASEDLRVVNVDIRVQTARTVRCFHTKQPGVLPLADEDRGRGRLIRPRTIVEAAFDIDARKSTLDDRSPSTLDVSFVIKWTRCHPDTSSSEVVVNTTTLPVPRFTLFGTEPRVLASVSHIPPNPPSLNKDNSSPRTPQLTVLHVIIENASAHFLTFGVSMEPSDEFAFSGPKQTTLNLLPVSRRSVTYRLLPLPRPPPPTPTPTTPSANKALPPTPATPGGGADGAGGTWIKPGLVVRDKYFQKVLRVIPTEGMKLDKDGGVLIWIPPDEEEGEARSGEKVEAAE
ncbi:Gryzun, putative trafficking through golgi-domain-containing protein [Lasiosphaeria miniovina]|uniref:Gryzun, putative trafficking through golgi-domain-containing protein n=1 Tax=Lasiosphaeria miniovina TaxID=1954250 RepID=A0AA40A586_9PEZI|nr:Gryzun, putative trafficking through golgi-domain-containing protein [Lasiosphaeria miniovina]KAK0709571.1 Gryzun, putative trafficking through golgi-domain-containing protein [Lasiosphaeria miniovina]